MNNTTITNKIRHAYQRRRCLLSRDPVRSLHDDKETGWNVHS